MDILLLTENHSQELDRVVFVALPNRGHHYVAVRAEDEVHQLRTSFWWAINSGLKEHVFIVFSLEVELLRLPHFGSHRGVEPITAEDPVILMDLSIDCQGSLVNIDLGKSSVIEKFYFILLLAFFDHNLIKNLPVNAEDIAREVHHQGLNGVLVHADTVDL